jgi:short-subunit dehydrogenase
MLNVASTAGIFPAPSMAAYAASKAVVCGLSEVPKMELAEHDVQVTTIRPGVINTPIVTVRDNVSASVSETQLVGLQGSSSMRKEPVHG